MENMDNISHSQLMNNTENVTNVPEVDGFDIMKMSYLAVPVLTLIGLLGNCLTTAVMFTQHFRKTTIGVYLTALATSDSAFLLSSPFTKMFVIKSFGYDPKALSQFGCKMFFFVYRSAKLCSSWFVIVICIERFIVIWLPLRAKVLSVKKIASLAVALITAGVLIFCGVWTVTSGVENGVCFPSLVTPDTRELSAAFVIVGTAIYNILPTFVMVFFTPLTVFRLYRQVRVRREISSGDGNDDALKVTRMVVAVMIAYIFLVTPISIAHSVAFFRGQNIFTSKDPNFVIFREIASTLEQVNYSINFFLYLSLNATFRRNVRGLCNWKPDENSRTLNGVATLHDRQDRVSSASMATDTSSETRTISRQVSYNP